jgi:hypothetical protein
MTDRFFPKKIFGNFFRFSLRPLPASAAEISSVEQKMRKSEPHFRVNLSEKTTDEPEYVAVL